MADIHVIWNDAAIKLLAEEPRVLAGMDRLAAGTVVQMKALCPVSPVGPLHRSGNLRSSIRAERQAGASIIVGPTADYGEYVNNGTVPHLIVSHGPWPLRNRETGEVFGRVVHHPGTRGRHFVEQAADQLNGVVIHI